MASKKDKGPPQKKPSESPSKSPGKSPGKSPSRKSPPQPEPKQCRHCGDRKVLRPRGLCYICYKDKAIRDRYPSLWSISSTGWGDTDFHRTRPHPPPCPTWAPPGSPEKITVLRDRAGAKHDLHHPHDYDPRRDGWTSPKKKSEPEPGLDLEDE